MRKCNFALRLQPSLLNEARKVAEAEGVALNQLINVAVADKFSALRVDDYFRERAGQDIMKAIVVSAHSAALTSHRPLAADPPSAVSG